MRLPKWFRWRSNEELDEELQAHIEDAVQLNRDRGMSPEEARYAARRAVGNPTQIKERAREADPFFKLELIWKDLQYAWRGLRRNPGFTFAAVISLALGIGANTAIFSFIDGLMLRPLPVPRAGEVVRVFGTTPQNGYEQHVSYREYTAFRDQNRSLTGLATETFGPFSIRVGNERVATYGNFVSGNIFSTLEVQPQLGRLFTAEDDTPAAQSIAVVLSHRIWSETFHGDKSLLGSAIRLNGKSAVLIGVLPPEYTGTDLTARPQVYVPTNMLPRVFPGDKEILTNPLRRSLNMIGRLKPGVTAETAQAEIVGLAARLSANYPDSDRERSAGLLPEIDARWVQSPDTPPFIVLLLGLVALVLLVACTNVANLLLGRASVRSRELAIRMSVGAGRSRLIGQLMTESVLLAVLGGALGLLMASWAASALSSIQLPVAIPFEFAVRLDNRALVYAAAAMVASVLIFGLWPAFAATRSELSARARTPLSKGRGRTALVVAQTALVAMMLIAAGLFARVFVEAGSANPGFRVNNVLIATFDPNLAGYDEVRTRTFYEELHKRAAALPGVRSASLASHVQLGPLDTSQAVVAAELDASDPRHARTIMYNLVTPDFFRTMDTPVLRGRALQVRDSATAPVVAVVNQTMANLLWPGQEPIGRRIRLTKFGKVAEVVGLARDGDYDDLQETPQPYFYLAFAQHPQSRMSLMLHTSGDAASMAPAVRAEAQRIAPDLPIHELMTMRSMFDGMGLLIPKLTAQLVSLMALIGLVLGITGLYAIMAFAVNQRTREFGIRMALGAGASTILRGVLSRGLRIASVGLCIGLAGAFAIANYFAPLMAHVNPRDPVIFGGVAILLLAVALAACYIPARRASLVDPAVTLRQE